MPELIAEPYETIENFAWFEPWLARGAQPDAGGFRSLEKSGVRCIVNLREASEARFVERVTRHARAVHIPVQNDRAPTREQALRWLDLCAQRADAKIFVHCHAGHGRTSTFCVLVRLAAGADFDRTIEEERKFGFDPQAKHRAQYDFLKAFNEGLRSGGIAL